MKIEEARRILLSDADFSGIGEKARLTADALVMAIEALEKQIPKKPHIINNWVLCPRCYEEKGFSCKFSVGTNREKDVRLPFCLVCGQAIDWSDEVEE